MKRNLFIAFLCGMALTSLFAFKSLYEAKKNTAEVETVKNMLVFMSSKPVGEFEYLGTVNCPAIVKSKTYEYMMPKMIDLAKEKYPNCDAVIFKDNNTWVVDAIKMK